MGGEVVEGTVISVLQAAGVVEQAADDDAGLADGLVAAGDAAAEALDRTPEQLAVLADARGGRCRGRGCWCCSMP